MLLTVALRIGLKLSLKFVNAPESRDRKFAKLWDVADIQWVLWWTSGMLGWGWHHFNWVQVLRLGLGLLLTTWHTEQSPRRWREQARTSAMLGYQHLTRYWNWTSPKWDEDKTFAEPRDQSKEMEFRLVLSCTPLLSLITLWAIRRWALSFIALHYWLLLSFIAYCMFNKHTISCIEGNPQ